MKITPTIVDGIRKFIRLTALIPDPQYSKRIRDELDLIDALEVIRFYVQDTKNMVGKKMYQKQPFDVVEDIKRATEEHFLTGREARDTALARFKNLMMYHLVLVPIIETFKDVEHKPVLKEADKMLDDIGELLTVMNVPSHRDDAIVALAQVGEMIKERENARKVELARRRRKKSRKKNKFVEWIERKEREVSPRF